MGVLPYIVDGSPESFPRLVLENSRRGPVAVNFWSPRAGPCFVAMPRLVRVAGDYGGRLFVVMLNTDEYGELARRLDVHALPMLKVFRNGEVVGTLQGVESEPELRRFLGGFVDQGSAVLQAYESGATQRAAQLAAQEALAHPDDPEAALRVAKLLVLDKRPDEAFRLLDALPRERRARGEIAILHAHLALLAAAAEPDDAPSPSARLFAAAARALLDEDYETACTHLFALWQREPGYREGLARKAWQAIASLPMPADVRSRIETHTPGDD